MSTCASTASLSGLAAFSSGSVFIAGSTFGINGNERRRRRKHAKFRSARVNLCATSENIPSGNDPYRPGSPPSRRGWDARDDEYWRSLRHIEKRIRAPHNTQFDPDKDFEKPKNRYGNPIEYPAQAKFDPKTGEIVPTTEEEEELLRNPGIERDPFYIEEADEDDGFVPVFADNDVDMEDVIELKPQKFDIDPTLELEALSRLQWGANAVNANDLVDAFRKLDDNAPSEIEDSRHQVEEKDEKEPAKTGMGCASFGAGGSTIDVGRKVVKTKRRNLGMSAGDWRLVHLGTSSAVPTRKRNVSSAAFLSMPQNATPSSREPHMVLVDAGENTEARLLDSFWGMTHCFRWICAICITHLHGDHVYGLPGILRAIGEFAQYRRREAIEKGEDTDPVIRIFGPYGTRGFLRSSLYWTVPLGVRFSVSELVPRENDFGHIRRAQSVFRVPGNIREIHPDGSTVESPAQDCTDMPPPHPEEIRVEDVHASEDGTWMVWDDKQKEFGFEIVAAPLKHRVACFGYVFREKTLPGITDEELKERELEEGNMGHNGAVVSPKLSDVDKGIVRIDMDKARAKGVYGSQFGVLRSGRSVVARTTGQIVRPEDVLRDDVADGTSSADLSRSKLIQQRYQQDGNMKSKERKKRTHGRKVVVLGDTCDSSEIAPAAMHADLLVHEATFASSMHAKALSSFHSTSVMAGAFARLVKARRLVLSHFSSRFEAFVKNLGTEDSSKDVGEDDAVDDGDVHSPSLLVREAAEAARPAKLTVVAALDYMEHTIDTKGHVHTKDRRENRHAVWDKYVGKNGNMDDEDCVVQQDVDERRHEVETEQDKNVRRTEKELLQFDDQALREAFCG